MTALARIQELTAQIPSSSWNIEISGTLCEVTPNHLRVKGLSGGVNLGDQVSYMSNNGEEFGEVIRIEPDSVLVKPYASRSDLGLGIKVKRCGELSFYPDNNWRGRIINAFGQPIDGLGPMTEGPSLASFNTLPPPPVHRARVKDAALTGVRVLDLFTPICHGQRLGIFAGSGVGKSTLLSMIARSNSFDTVVIGLIGERGREVREFVEETLGDQLSKSVVVVATGDESPMMRRLAPKTAMTVAEHFRDQGQSVLLIVDSVTRYAHALRDVALAAGEPALSRGYPPSVFSELPLLLERAGPGIEGSGMMTAIFSVLVDGDDHNDPVADNIRGLLDGHVVLDRHIAEEGRYPAVNVLGSISRLAQSCWSPQERELILKLKAMIAKFEDTKDLRMMGGYKEGVDPLLDQAIEVAPKVYNALVQGLDAPSSQDAFTELAQLL
ncbi:Flagellum-specific ATP synthase [Pseudovibrio sp. W64]|jgi:flagellum-specific ATP synthase|uniref:flagellar protein export ATPase FliI n=1 Tax=Pseudovibrio TaxID=258255 RepID=UPI0007AE8922|nr:MULTISPECIES: flagellar protein export ATPase FliI [Pseudovibrio]KZK81863.1 Flagellum-specific ATP synthase [Pseudovibrio sp. W64]KZK86509.1 Flagellum-specific ATP synthase [Pseudovibrio sp. Ad46]KZK96008.1 Flagellum-specific ATP synthase [Pseudovibrio sp. W74]KZL08557.1 Flagellum-specific ATP synthase [Pseudovibrio sp. Ad14]